MKKTLFICLLFALTTLITNVYSQTVATSEQSTIDNKDWILKSGAGLYYSSPSQIILDGSGDGFGGSVKIWAASGMTTNGNIELQSYGKIILRQGTNENNLTRVGIGFNSPAEALHINGNIRGNQIGGALRIQTSYGFIDLGPQNSTCANLSTNKDYFLFNAPVSSTGNFRFQTDGVTRMILDAGGKVGFGSINPIGKFQVGSQYRVFLDDNIFVESTGWKKNMIGFNAVRRSDGLWETQGDGTSNGGSVIACEGNGGFHFYSFPSTGGTTSTHTDSEFVTRETFSSDASGNLFIANALRIGNYANSSTYKLSVDGKVIAEEIVVKTSENWPDYVFNSSYNLLSIDALEKFISENHHLPNVPTKEDVKRDGISIGEMNKILLEKIEETTLYLIEMKNQNELLMKRISMLEESMNFMNEKNKK